MKVLLTGGGSGGHFYPLIAVAEEMNRLVKEEKLLPVQLFYMSDAPYDADALLQNGITFIPVSAGKARRYFSLLNILDVFKTVAGIFSAMGKVFSLYPDVVFSKGAYTSFPVLFAARFFRIPVIVHESDSTPGRANAWAGKFAARIAVSYPDAAQFFKNKDRIAVTGNPIRSSVKLPAPRQTAREYLDFSENIPVLLILGGSLGAKFINETIAEILPQLVDKYYVIHQIGKTNMEEAIGAANIFLDNHPHKLRYRPFDYLDDLHMSMASGAADLVISRAGSTIFEIASWGVPSILIPITDTNGDHQRKNAYYYATFGATVVIEEGNLSPNILLSEIDRAVSSPDLLEKMRAGAKSFAKPDAATLIAREILNIGISHEQ